MENKEKRKRIFNHLDVELLNYQVFSRDYDPRRKAEYFGASLRDYPGRSLCLTEEGDVIQISPNIRHGWKWINAHYDRVGLSRTRSVIWDDDIAIIKKFPNHDLSAFIFGEAIHKIRPDGPRVKSTKVMNSKNGFIRLCGDLGVSTPRTRCFQSKNEMPLFDNFPFPAYLKADVSVSGLGIIYCKTKEDLKNELARVDANAAFQIQEEIDAASFVNLQYRVDNYGAIERIAATEQILKGYSHCGNIFPSKFAPWHITDKLAQFLADSGIKDVFGFDVIVAKDGEYFALECNPRYNGSTYPAITASKLGIKSWKSRVYATNFQSLEQLRVKGLEYDSSTKSGIIVINWGCINQKKLGILIAGGFNEQIKIEKKLCAIL